MRTLAAVANQRHRAVLGDDGGERPSCSATARLQPIGRPVTAITGRPAARKRRERGDDAHRDGALGRQRVVDVGEDAAHAGAGAAARNATTA